MKVDLDTALSAVVDELQGRLSSNNDEQSFGRSRETWAELTRITAFKSQFDNLVLTEIIQRPEGIQSHTENAERLLGTVSAHDAQEQKSAGNFSEGPVRLPVLTLYGGGPQPKQLFSSLQNPSAIETRAVITRDKLREEALPNGISTSKVIPVHGFESSQEREKVPTLGELFPPPPTVQPLNPPRQSRLTGVRSSTVNWVKASDPVPSSNAHRRTYPQQPLATGAWISYNAVPSSTLQASSEEKRRQRDRALSSGESQLSRTSVATQAAHCAAKEDALFCSVYSSFAPVKDNSSAIVPDHSKESVWWSKRGERKYRELFQHQAPGFTGENAPQLDKAPQTADIYDDEISAVVEGWTPAELPRELMGSKGDRKFPDSTSEIDLLIGEISELLETLHSFQRIRSFSSTNSGLTTTNPDLSGLSSSSVAPSTAELDVYNMLQSQLAVIISSLPPYAVSKLDGERLGLLKTSTKIPIEGKIYAGTIEEDEVPAKPRTISTSSAVSYSPRPTNVNSAVPARVNGYSHNTPTPAIPRSAPGTVPRVANNSTPQLPNQQYSSRPASSNHYFTGTAHSSYPPQRTAAMTAERFSHSKTPQYPQRPAAQSPHTPLPNGYRAHPSQNGPPHSQQYAASSHGVMSPASVDPASKVQRPSQQPGHQQKALSAVGYQFPPNTPGRESSPSKTKASTNPAPRLPPTTPAPSVTQTRQPMYHPPPAAPNATSQSVNGNGGGGGGASSVAPPVQPSQLTRAEQEAVMNSQKVRLAQHDGQSRPGSGTPQPGAGTHRATVNVPAAVSQPNGV